MKPKMKVEPERPVEIGGRESRLQTGAPRAFHPRLLFAAQAIHEGEI